VLRRRAVADACFRGFIHESESQPVAWVQGRPQKVVLMGLQANEWDVSKRQPRLPL
jgi:hypothetical protein